MLFAENKFRICSEMCNCSSFFGLVCIVPLRSISQVQELMPCMCRNSYLDLHESHHSDHSETIRCACGKLGVCIDVVVMMCIGVELLGTLCRKVCAELVNPSIHLEVWFCFRGMVNACFGLRLCSYGSMGNGVIALCGSFLVYPAGTWNGFHSDMNIRLFMPLFLHVCIKSWTIYA